MLPRLLTLGVLAVPVVLLPALAPAAPPEDVGSSAPAVEPEEWVNFPGATPSWAALKGRAILVDRWATWCGPCIASIPHLNEWHEKYEKKGLAIVGVTDEPSSKVKPFMAEKGAKYVIATGVKGVYQNPSIPHAWLISPAGEVVWRGHPASLQDSAIEEQLRSARMQPEFSLPKALERAGGYLNAGAFGKGIEALERYLKSPKDEDVAKAAREALETATAFGKGRLEDAKKSAEAGQYPYAVSVVSELAKSFQGTAIGKDAKSQQDAWKRDPKVRVELEAAAIVDQADKHIREKNYKAASGLLQGLLRSKKHGSTQAVTAAKEKLRQIEKYL
jgi:thiol-disulfide isomerase/thioredoxin